jgi:hypothetical protein
LSTSNRKSSRIGSTVLALMTPEICCNCLSKEEEDTINFIAFFGLWRNYRFSDYQGKNSFSNRRHAPVGDNCSSLALRGRCLAVLSSFGPLCSLSRQGGTKNTKDATIALKDKEHTYNVLRTTYYVIRFSLPLPHALFFQKPHSGASFAKAKTLLRLPGAMP